jgi:hypothetical protein
MQEVSLPHATTDGIPAEAGDAGKTTNRPTPLLAGEKPDDKAPTALVEDREEAIDVAVGTSNGPTGMASAVRTRTMVRELCHGVCPPEAIFATTP